MGATKVAGEDNGFTLTLKVLTHRPNAVHGADASGVFEPVGDGVGGTAIAGGITEGVVFRFSSGEKDS